MSREFKLEGRITDSKGGGLGGLLVAVIDTDTWDADDFIAVGSTADDGGFRVSFRASEFQQDAFEDEATPDLKLIISAKFGEAFKPVFAASFDELDWSDGSVHLGKVSLRADDPTAMTPLKGVEAMPGIDKRVVRLDLNDDLIRDCIAEVAPIVEKLTGWSDLVEGVNVCVSDSLASFSLKRSFEAEGIDPDSFQAKLSTFIAKYAQASGAGCALYDPVSHTIVINKTIMEQVGLDGLKSMVGHELVHLGQYKYTPGLKAYNAAMIGKMSLDPEKVDLDEVKAGFAYMEDLESYAVYIQMDFLQKQFYPMAVYPYHQSLGDSMLRGLVGMIMPNAEETQKMKADQYTAGLDAIRARQQGDTPARFELDVAALPGGAEFV